MDSSIVSSIVKSYKGRAVRIDKETKYVCLTDMAAANGKLFADWYRLKSTTEYLSKFSSSMGIPIDELIMTTSNASNEDRGTWAHQKIAIRFAQWCSVEFAIQVDFWVDELLAFGKVELKEQAKLSSRELAVETAVAIDRIQDMLGKSNPRLAQLLVDHAVNDVLDARQALAASTEFPGDRWYGLTEVADRMGIKTNQSTRVLLGNFVSKLGLERVRESRLCNGTMREIWCYRDDSKTRNAIEQWKVDFCKTEKPKNNNASN